MAMSAVIGNLRANLGLDTAQFDRGLNTAQSRLERAQQDFMRFAAGAAAVGTALGALGVQTINSAHEISRLSKLANAAPAEFQRWAAAAETVGVEQDKMADILKDVGDRVGDFMQTGGGPMRDFFEQIAPQVGVTAEQFARLSGPEALQLYVDSLEKAGVSQSEMTFYLEAMASDLTLLQPLLRDGGEELDRLGDRAEGFGAVMDRQTIRSLSRTKESLEEVQTVFRGFGNMLGTAVAPMIRHTADSFVALSQEGAPLNTAMRALSDNLGVIVRGVTTLGTLLTGRLVVAFIAARTAALGLRAALVRTGIGIAVVAAGELVYQFSRLVSGAGSFGEAMVALEAISEEIWERVKQGINAIPPALKAASAKMKADFIDALGDMLQSFEDFTNKIIRNLNETFSITLFESEIPGLSKYNTELNLDIPPLEIPGIEGGDSSMARARRKALEEEIAARRRLAEATEGLGDPLESLEGFRDKTKGAEGDMDAAAGAAGRLNEALGNVGGGAGGSGGSGGGGAGSASSAADGIDEISDSAAEAERRSQRMRDTMSRTFASIVTGSQSASEAIGQMLTRFADMLAQQGFNQLLGTVFGGSGGGGGIGSWLGGLFGGNANGTNNWRGGWTMVGERGRELVNLPQGSQVVRNSETEAMMGGVTVNFSPTIDARGADQAAVERLERSQRQMAAEFEPRVYKALKKASNTGADRAWRS